MSLLAEIKKSALAKPFIDLSAIERDLAIAKVKAESRKARNVTAINETRHAELIASDIKRFEEICKRIAKVQASVVDGIEKVQKELSDTGIVEGYFDDATKAIKDELKESVKESNKNWSDLSASNKKMLRSISQMHVDLIKKIDDINTEFVVPEIKIPEMPKLPKMPKVDLSGINGKLDSLLEDAPKEWEFEVIRDRNGLISRVVAQEI